MKNVEALLIDDLTAIADDYGVNLVFEVVDTDTTRAFYDCGNDTIFLQVFDHSQSKPSWLISAFFHELGHAIAFRDGSHANYHHAETYQDIVNLGFKAALAAELWVDRLGEKLAKIHYPGVRFQRSYRSLAHRQYLKKYLGFT